MYWAQISETVPSKLSIKKISPVGTDGRLPLSDLDLDLGSGHTAYRRASVIDLYLRTKCHWYRKKNSFESHPWGFGQVQSDVTQKLASKHILRKYQDNHTKISPVGDWRSTSLEWPWPWPWFRPYGIPSCITHRPLPTYQISSRSEEIFLESHHSPPMFWSSSESRDTKTRTNVKNPAWSNLDIVL